MLDPHSEKTPTAEGIPEKTNETVMTSATNSPEWNVKSHSSPAWLVWLIEYRKVVCFLYILLGAAYLWQVVQKPKIAAPYFIEIEKLEL